MVSYDINLRNKIYAKAVGKWGVESQMVAALEELAELQVEIAKQFNGKRVNTSSLIDELADARIMIEQMELNFGCGTLVEERMQFKLEKLEEVLR